MKNTSIEIALELIELALMASTKLESPMVWAINEINYILKGYKSKHEYSPYIYKVLNHLYRIEQYKLKILTPKNLPEYV
jgi:hypothetical protein